MSTSLTGKVSLVGVLNNTGTSGATTPYPVIVGLDPSTLNLFDGAGATVTIAVGAATNVLTVPTSALHTLATLHAVTVDKFDTISTVRVTIGSKAPTALRSSLG